MQHRKVFRGDTSQKPVVIAIESLNMFGCQRGTDAATASKSSSPRFPREWDRLIECEHDVKTEIRRSPAWHRRELSRHVGPGPFGVVLQDQLFGSPGNGILLREPAKAADNQKTVWLQDSLHFGDRPGPVEVQPGLTRRHGVER